MKTLAARITTLTDARYFAAREVDFLAFRLEEQMDGHIDPMNAKAIKEWVEGPVILGEFEFFGPGVVRETIDFLGLDGVVLGPSFSTKSLFELSSPLIFRELLEKNPARLAAQLTVEREVVEAFLIDADLYQSGFLGEIAAQYPVFLKSSARPEEVANLVRTVRPAGFVFIGGDELKVGQRSFEEVEAVFDLLF